MAFCTRLSARTGRKVRLATEAEWEYACRAGSKTRYYFGDDEKQLGDYAWFRDNCRGSTHPVGQKRPNAWGLYDMNGNIGQWCADLYAGPTQRTDRGPKPANLRVFRGGFWWETARELRSAQRFWSVPGARSFYVGLRVAMDSQ